MHALNFPNTSRHVTSKRLRVSSFLVRGLLAGHDGGVALEAGRADHAVERRSRGIEEGPHQGDRLGQIGEQVFVGPGRIGLAAVPARLRAGEGRQRLAQVLEDAAVVHDQTVVLALVHPVGAGDGLHQRMGLEGLVEIEGGEARHVEAGEPHGADHGDAEGVLPVPEGVVERHPPHVAEAWPAAQGLRQVHALLDQPAVRGDVQTPRAELLHLALLLAHHHRHAGLAHPVRPAPQEDRLLLVRHSRPLRLQRLDTFLPVALDQPEHPHAGHLVDAHQHRLAGLPGRRVVPHEVPRHLLEPLPGGDDVVVALELPLQALRHVDVAGRFERLQLLGDALVQIPDRHPQLVAAGVVVEGHGGLVLHRALEVVGRDVVAEHPPRELVAGEQRRAGKADVAGVRQGVAHVQRQRAVLGTVRLVGDDDDVVARGTALAGHDVPVELLDQREDVRLVLRQQPAQVLPARGPGRGRGRGPPRRSRRRSCRSGCRGRRGRSAPGR